MFVQTSLQVLHSKCPILIWKFTLPIYWTISIVSSRKDHWRTHILWSLTTKLYPFSSSNPFVIKLPCCSLGKCSQTQVEREVWAACGCLMYCETLSQDFKADSDCCRWEEGFPQKYLFKTHGAVIHMVGTCDSFLMMLGSFNSQNHCRYHKILSSVAKKVYFMQMKNFH